MTNLLTDCALSTLLGAALLAGALWALGHVGWVSTLTLSVVGTLALLLTARRLAVVFLGKRIADKTWRACLLGETKLDAEVIDSTQGGRVIVLLTGSWERFSGPVTAFRLRDSSEVELGRVELPRLLPRRGSRWRRGTGISSDPIVIPFATELLQSDRLRLQFGLNSSFAGTLLNDRFPSAKEEVVRVIVRSRLI